MSNLALLYSGDLTKLIRADPQVENLNHGLVQSVSISRVTYRVEHVSLFIDLQVSYLFRLIALEEAWQELAHYVLTL